MGIDIYYCRVSVAQFQQLLETHDEAAATVYMQQDWGWFPYSIKHFQVTTSAALNGLLNPTNDPTSILRHVVEGATPLTNDHSYSSQIYLQQVRYLIPSEVQEIAHAFVQLEFTDVIENFALMMEVTHQESREIIRHPEFASAFRLFEQAMCFFQIAAEAGDGILRRYNG